MLTTTLRKLWRDGIVTRTVHDKVPPPVEYALTDLGSGLAARGKALGSWVQANLPAFSKPGGTRRGGAVAVEARNHCVSAVADQELAVAIP